MRKYLKPQKKVKPVPCKTCKGEGVLAYDNSIYSEFTRCTDCNTFNEKQWKLLVDTSRLYTKRVSEKIDRLAAEFMNFTPPKQGIGASVISQIENIFSKPNSELGRIAGLKIQCNHHDILCTNTKRAVGEHCKHCGSFVYNNKLIISNK